MDLINHHVKLEFVNSGEQRNQQDRTVDEYLSVYFLYDGNKLQLYLTCVLIHFYSLGAFICIYVGNLFESEQGNLQDRTVDEYFSVYFLYDGNR